MAEAALTAAKEDLQKSQDFENSLKTQQEKAADLSLQYEAAANLKMNEGRFDVDASSQELMSTLPYDDPPEEDEPPFIDEQHRPAGRSRSRSLSMNGGRGDAANHYFNWVQDDIQRRAEQQQRHGYAATDPGPARGGWDAPPQPQGWDAPPPPPVAPPPQYPRMMPSNAEDRRDPRDAAGPAAKRARATRHDAAAKSSGHGGMKRFLEKR